MYREARAFFSELLLYWKVKSSIPLLLFSVIVLTFLGLITLSSASQFMRSDAYYFFRKQIAFVLLGCFASAFMFWVNLNKLRKYTAWIAGFALFLLVLCLIPGIGVKVNGAQRWIDLRFIRIQASDIAKLGLVFILAHYLGNNQHCVREFWRGFMLPSFIIALFSGLILIEPDFGTAFLCGLVGFSILFLAGVRLIYLLPTLFLSGTFFGIAVSLSPVRLKRITSFLDIEGNKLDGSYQLWQGILGFASGGFSGTGLGNGRQQMAFLPEAHTDFIFPVIGEEMGFLFALSVVLLFGLIFLLGYLGVKQAPSLYHYCLVSGSLLFVVIQAILNMGVVTGLLPTKGMSMPFISYGGSGIVIMFMFVGILLNSFSTWHKVNF